MFNTLHPSLEEMPMAFEGHVQLPVICDHCYHALHKERGIGSCPKSYIAIAKSSYSYTVTDWQGFSTRSCHCCASREYESRFSVELRRRR